MPRLTALVLAHGQTWQSATDRTNAGLIAVRPSA
jgi:hypothetical protein